MESNQNNTKQERQQSVLRLLQSELCWGMAISVVAWGYQVLQQARKGEASKVTRGQDVISVIVLLATTSAAAESHEESTNPINKDHTPDCREKASFFSAITG